MPKLGSKLLSLVNDGGRGFPRRWFSAGQVILPSPSDAYILEHGDVTRQSYLNPRINEGAPLKYKDGEVNGEANIRNIVRCMEYVQSNVRIPHPHDIQVTSKIVREALTEAYELGGKAPYTIVTDGGYIARTGMGAHAEVLLKEKDPLCVWVGARKTTSIQDMELETLKQAVLEADYLKFLMLTENDEKLRAELLSDADQCYLAVNQETSVVTLLNDNEHVVNVINDSVYNEKADSWSNLAKAKKVREAVIDRGSVNVVHISSKKNIVADTFVSLTLKLAFENLLKEVPIQRYDFYHKAPFGHGLFYKLLTTSIFS